MERLTARTSDELVAVRRRLHDAWFEVPEPGVFPEPSVVVLSGLDERPVVRERRVFGLLAERERSKARLKLSISNVTEVDVEDDARIGSFDLGGLVFEEDCVVITGNVPVEVRCRVTGLDIAAEISDELVPSGSSWGFRRTSSPGGGG